MAIDSYTNLKTAITAWMVRTGDTAFTGEEDNLIDLFEKWFNRKYPGYRRELTVTLNTDANGEVPLPAGFISMVSLTYNGYPVTAISWDALANQNPTATGGSVYNYAISGATLKTAFKYDGDLACTYQSALPSLTVSVTSNWLLALAPDVYLSGCMAQGYKFLQDMQNAALQESMAVQGISELGIQAMVAQYGNARMVTRGATP